MKKLVTLVLSLSVAMILAVSASAATVYVDIDFGSDGSYVDAKGNAVLSNYCEEYYEHETIVKDTTVTHNGKTYTVPAYVIDQYAQGQEDGKDSYGFGLFGYVEAWKDKAAYKEWYEGGVTYEMFVQYTGKFNSSNSYSVCLMGNTWYSGQGFYLNCNESTYGAGSDNNVQFITHSQRDNGYLRAVSRNAPINKELTHIVGTWEYDADAKLLENRVYVNGVLMDTQQGGGGVSLHGTMDWSYFGIGCSTSIGDGKDYAWNYYAIDGLIVADAKIYQGVVTDAEVATMYKNAVAALAAADTGAAKTETKVEETKTETKVEETKTEETKTETTTTTTTETKTETKTETSVPKTGDASVIMAAMSVLAGAGLCAVSFKKKED